MEKWEDGKREEGEKGGKMGRGEEEKRREEERLGQGHDKHNLEPPQIVRDDAFASYKMDDTERKRFARKI